MRCSNCTCYICDEKGHGHCLCRPGLVAADAEGACVYVTCHECHGTGFTDNTAPVTQTNDRFSDMFERQEKFMQLLRDNDRMPEWPLDLTTKPSQRLIKETVWNMVEELAEASYTLKNRMHRMTDARVLDIQHYKEELGDALAYLLELCILSGFTPQEVYEEYCRKNKIVQERLESGY